MRTLYLCRHAKSSWADAGQHDHDRPLNERGLRDAPFMAELFRKRDEPIDLIVSSTAVRALSTASAYAEALGLSGERFRSEPKLYHPTPTAINTVLNSLPNTSSRVMLFGHNPGFSDAVTWFTGDQHIDMPTSGIARIDFLVDDWALVTSDIGTLAWFDHPKAHIAL